MSEVSRLRICPHKILHNLLTVFITRQNDSKGELPRVFGNNLGGGCLYFVFRKAIAAASC